MKTTNLNSNCRVQLQSQGLHTRASAQSKVLKWAKRCSLALMFILLVSVFTFSVFSVGGTENVVLADKHGGGGSNAINLNPTLEQFIGETDTSYRERLIHNFNDAGTATLKLTNPATLSWWYEFNGGSSIQTASVEGNSFTLSADKHGIGYTGNLYAAVNFKLTSTYLYYLMYHDLATVTATLNYTFQPNNNNDHDYFSKIQQSGGTINASTKPDCEPKLGMREGEPIDVTQSVTLSTSNYAGNDTSGRYTHINLLFRWYQGVNRTMDVTVKDMQVDFVATFTKESYKPRMTAAEITNSATTLADLPVTFDAETYANFPELLTTLANALDSVVPTTTDVHKTGLNLRCYRKEYLSGSSSYYKQVSLTFYDYGASKDTSGSLSTASKLRQIEFGDEGIFYAWLNSSKTSNIMIDGVNVGTVTFTRVNKSYVTAVMKFSKNTNFTVTVTDFNYNTNSTEIVVSGIDSTAPDDPMGATDENLVAAPTSTTQEAYDNAYALAKWWNGTKYTMMVDALSAEQDEAPIVYYYNISYSLTGAHGTFTDLTGDTSNYPRLPADYGKVFAANYATTVEFDFTQLSGSGYYIIALQAKDLAGNNSAYSSVNRYFIKVDYDSPKYTIDLVKGTGTTPYENGAWATDQIKATLTVTSRTSSLNSYHSETNLSGNMLVYTGADFRDHYIITMGGVITSSDAFGTLTNAGTANASYFDGTLTITYSKGVYTIICGNLANQSGGYQNVDFTALFTVYSGTSMDGEFLYPTGSDIVADDPTLIFRSDRNNPMSPILADESGGKIFNSMYIDTNIPIESRNWYTDGWSILASTQFFDDLMENYSNDIVIYVGIMVNDFKTGFSAQNVLSGYLDGTYASYIDALNAVGFDGVIAVPSTMFDGGGDMLIDLLQSYGSGLRNLYIWAVDQAYNTSGATEYQILVDGNSYKISAQIDAETIAHFSGIDVASMEFTNDLGETVTTFKRGETIFINLEIAYGFLPYKITLSQGGGTPTDFYVNTTMSGDYASPYPDDLTLTMSGKNIRMLIDRENIADSPSTLSQNYNFSFRKVVSLTLGNSVVIYNGTQNDIDYLVTNPDSEYTLNGFPSTNFAEFTSMYYLSYTDEENFVLTDATSGANFDGGAPKNVGQYTARTKVDGQFYVSEMAGTVYVITKLATTLTAVASGSLYGDEVNLTAMLDAVGDDISLGVEAISGSLVLQNVDSLEAVSAGVYNIIMGVPFEYQNYDITFVSALYTVNPKTVNITVTEGQGKTYGDADPTILYTVDEGQTLADDISEIILGGGIIRMNGEDVTPLGYIYSTSNAGFTLNSNYNLNIQSSDNFMIAKRDIVITPAQSQSAIYYIDAQYDILYSIASADRIYAEFIVGAMSLDGEPSVGLNAITLGGLSVDLAMAHNLELVLSGEIYFNLIEPGDVVISLKSSFTASITYKDACPSDSMSEMFDFSSEKFDVTGLEEFAFYSISWQWVIPTYEQGDNVGKYLVAVSDFIIMAGESAETATDITSTLSITMGSIFLDVLPAIISVQITNSNLERVYGSDEIALTFSLSSAVGSADEWAVTVGSFRRAVFDASGMLVALGTRFDCINSGLISQYAEGYYYGATVAEKFECNPNFVIEYTNLESIRFTVSPFKIQLTNASFFGKSRDYNASTVVGYIASDNTILFTKARPSDNVTIKFSANYNSADAQGSGKQIRFTQISLMGADSTNYALLYDGNYVDGGTVVTITKMSSLSEFDDIAIYPSDFELLKQDIEVVKQYDGTTSVVGENVKFLRGILASIDSSAITAIGDYPQAGKSANLTVNIMISIALTRANQNLVLIPSLEENMLVSLSADGIVISTVLNDAEIIARVLTLDSFEFAGVDKRYDNASSASVSYEYAQDALGEGDTKADVPLNITAHFATLADDVYENALNAGNWTVLLTNITLTNPNYVLEITPEDFASFTTLSANILPTRLTPDIKYSTVRQYDGTANVSYTTTAKFIVYGGDPVVADELAKLSFALTSIIMSLNGEMNTQVMFSDAQMTITKLHNVLLSGFNATADEGVLLGNYVLVGYRYNSGTGEYDEYEIALADGTLDDFELIEVATLRRKELNIQTSSISINDKYYDATTAGSGSINKNDIGIVEGEKDFIGMQFSVRFTGVDVSTVPVKAYIEVQHIINEVAAGGVDYARNYKMKDDANITAFGYANIMRAPLTFDIALANKTYDGTRNTSIVSYSLYGVIDARDYGKYALGFLFGAFSDVNAADVVTGSAYGLFLSYNGYTDGTSSYKNYTLTYDLTASEWEAINGEAIASEEENYYMTKVVNDVVTHYFTLHTKQFTKLLSSSYDLDIHGFVYNTVQESGSTYYYVDYIGSGSDINLSGFEAASGSIFKKSVTVTASLTTLGSEVLNNRVYDGTVDYAGGAGTHFTVTIGGICNGEDVTVDDSNISVAYNNPNASALPNDRLLVVRITELSGEDRANYSFSGATANFQATIKKAVVSVSIANKDGEKDGVLLVQYGDTARPFQLIFNDGVHMLEDGITSALYVAGGKLGYNGDHDNDPETPDQFIVLDPNIKLPTIVDGTNNFTNSGVYALNLTGGDSTNYVFNFVKDRNYPEQKYRILDSNGEPTANTHSNVAGIIVIEKVVLYAYAVDKYADAENMFEYMKIYNSANPAITIGYAVSTSSLLSGFKNGQSASGLIGAGLFVAPVVNFRVFNTITGEWGASVENSSYVNEKLSAGEIYAIEINVTNTPSRNYIVKSRYEELYRENYPEKYAIDDLTSLGEYLAELLVMYASIDGIVMRDVAVTYDGKSHKTTGTGTVENDVITYSVYKTVAIFNSDNVFLRYEKDTGEGALLVDNVQNVTNIINAGVYWFEVKVSRENYRDYQGSALLTIRPKSVSLTLRRLIVPYDGNSHEITENNAVVIGETAVHRDDITYIYRLDGVEQSSLPKNAGTYLVQACYNPATATNTTNASNYAYTLSPAVTLIINPIIVNITVGARKTVYDPEVNNDLQYEATLSSEFEGFGLPDIFVEYRDPYSETAYEGVYYESNYKFLIFTHDVNYQLRGDTSGDYFVGMESVAEVRSDGASRASAKVMEGSLIYAKTELKYNIKANNSTNRTLWSQVTSNVAAIGTFFKPYETSAILDVAMVTIVNEITTRIQPDGTILLTMELPKGAANGDKLYVVNSEGKLQELSYTYNDGQIQIETNYVGYFVFVKEGSFPWWFIGVIGGVVVLAAVIALIAVMQKKKKAKDMQLVTVGENADGTPIQMTVKEKREQDKIAAQNAIEQKKRQEAEARAEQEKKRKAMMDAAAAEAAKPAVRVVMKADQVDAVATGKIVNAQKAVAADADKPKIMKALPADEPKIMKALPADDPKVKSVSAPLGTKPAQRPQGAPPRPQGTPTAQGAPPRPQGAPQRPQGAPPRPQGAPKGNVPPRPNTPPKDPKK